MEKPKTKDAVVLKSRIKDLEKALEKAKVLIYGLNVHIGLKLATGIGDTGPIWPIYTTGTKLVYYASESAQVK